MKKVLLGAVSTIALLSAIGVAPAPAADLPSKALPMAPPVLPVASWTGFYIGANIGAGRYNTNLHMVTETGACGDSVGVNCNNAATGVVGGVQIGYNWQTSRNTVFGVEADWNWTGFDHTNTDFSGFFTQAKMDWIATFRGRMGLAVDTTMVYVTGGLAVADIKTTWGGPGYTANDGTRTKAGWVAGLGVEHMFSPNWTVKGEVLYHDFGTESRTRFEPFNGGTYTTNFNHEVVTAKIGINYKFW